VKVILRENVDNLGERGETVTVAAGYARNYLLPKGLAYPATPGNLKVIEDQRRVWDARDAREREEAEALAEKFSAVKLAITKKAGESGTLYGSVTNSEIAELLQQQGFEVDRRRIVLAEPIKTLGQHEIQVKIHKNVDAKLQLQVEAEAEAE
jgi:large subunit ribosomal protein L9